MKIKLTAAETAEQLQQLAELAEQIWNEYFITIISQEQIDYMLERFQSYEALQQQAKQGYQYYFIVHHNEIIGYTAVQPAAGKLFLSKFYLQQQYRGKGYGSAALEQLKQHQAASIWLTVNRYNDATIAMYKHKGFVVVKEQAADIGNGFVMDDYIMELAL